LPATAGPVGLHVSASGRLGHAAPEHALAVGAEAVQVFLANPRGWATPDGDRASDRTFRERCEAEGWPAFVHAPYLGNPGAPDPVTAERSSVSLAHSLRRGREVGARGVVVHTGSAVRGSRDDGLARARELLLPVLDALPDDGPDLLLEPTAGQGASLCSLVDDVAAYLDVLDGHPRVGLCLDTCHVHAAGHDLSAPGAVGAVLEGLEAAAPGRLRLVHANDSADVAGSHKDRHARVGEGTIGTAPFAELMAHPLAAGVPLVLETPGDRPDHAAELEVLKALRG
jgi:deoxyribonuclease-4